MKRFLRLWLINPADHNRLLSNGNTTNSTPEIMKSNTNAIFSRFGPAGAASIYATALTLVLLSLPVFLQAQTLRNEWSFNESGGTTAVDAISHCNIMLVGGASLGGGVLTLPGGGGNYAKFPDGILSTFTNSTTIETWFTDTGGPKWGRGGAFGGSTTNFIPNNGNYICLIPQESKTNNNHCGFCERIYPGS